MKNNFGFICNVFTLKSYGLITVFAALIVSGCGGGETRPTGFDPNYRLIVPDTAVVSAAGNIDGLLNDSKWNDSFRLDLIEGVTASGVIMEGVADSSNLYFYFEIGEANLSTTDFVAIAINPSSTATDKRLLLLYPCPSGGAGCPLDATDLPVDIDYFLDANNDGTWEPQIGGHGVVARASVAGGDTWTIEVSIPRGAPFNLPSTGYFGLYTNVLATDTIMNPADQYTWPFNNDGGGTLMFGTVEDVPADSIWGNATLDTSIGNGVRISTSDISTNHNTTTISWNEENIFTAIAHNNTLTSGSLTTAQDVRATFNWANFGLASHSSFQRIPTAATPAPGSQTAYQDILPTMSGTYQFNWTVPIAERPFYQANTHWCLRVELESSNPSTIFYNQSAQRNMNFVETSSPFLGLATIDARGYKLPEGFKRHEYIIEERFYNFDPKLKWSSELKGVEKIAKQKYTMKISPGEPQKIDLAVLPPREALVPFEMVNIKPANQSGLKERITKLSVKPGTLITLMVDEQPIKGQEPKRSGVTPALLQMKEDGIGNPRMPGLLKASWDGFKKSHFIINNTISIKTPKDKTTLYLMADRGSAQENSPDISLRVYTTEVEDYHLRADSSLALDRAPNGIVNLGANLPTVIYRGKRNMGGKITIRDKTFNVYQSVGAFGYIVKGTKSPVNIR